MKFKCYYCNPTDPCVLEYKDKSDSETPENCPWGGSLTEWKRIRGGEEE